MRDQTILIVDDSPGNLMVLGEVLSPVYRVQAANSGARALELAAGDPKPDLILLDVMMPGLDGYATLERLRADPATREIPVIFVTAMDTDEDEQRGLDHGAVDRREPVDDAEAAAALLDRIQALGYRDAVMTATPAPGASPLAC